MSASRVAQGIRQSDLRQARHLRRVTVTSDSDLGTTALHYLDKRSRTTTGLGVLLWLKISLTLSLTTVYDGVTTERQDDTKIKSQQKSCI